MRLLLIRHGESVANTEGRLQGQLDSPLTCSGRKQAHALARRLVREGVSISAIHASDLVRAAETAGILAAELHAPLLLDRRLREYDVGVLTGLTPHEIESLYPDIWQAMRHSRVWVPVPGEEGVTAFADRLAAWLADLRSRYGPGEAVAVVSHGGSLGMMLAHFLGMDPQRPTPFHFGNASLTVVELRPRGPILTCLNDTCHLDGDLP